MLPMFERLQADRHLWVQMRARVRKGARKVEALRQKLAHKKRMKAAALSLVETNSGSVFNQLRCEARRFDHLASDDNGDDLREALYELVAEGKVVLRSTNHGRTHTFYHK